MGNIMLVKHANGKATGKITEVIAVEKTDKNIKPLEKEIKQDASSRSISR